MNMNELQRMYWITYRSHCSVTTCAGEPSVKHWMKPDLLPEKMQSIPFHSTLSFWFHLQVKTSQQKSVKIIVFIFNIMIYIHLSYDDIPDGIFLCSFAIFCFAHALRYWVPSFVKEKRFHNWLTEATGINKHLPSKMLGRKCYEKQQETINTNI